MSDQRAKKPWFKRPLWRWILVLWAVILVVDLVAGRSGSSGGKAIPYSDFKAQLVADNIASVSIAKTKIKGRFRTEVAGEQGFSTVPVPDERLLADLEAKGVEIQGVAETSSTWSSMLGWMFPLLAIVALLWLMRRGAGGAGMLTVGRSKARIYTDDEVDVSFDDVAGVDEAKEELREVIDFLAHPERFRHLGGTLPKGILLLGPPGTGKTLLARAVAGEAKVPFFSISGSSFVEMFVGVGAARVRDLFNDARSRAPCIVFIDELDALGKARGMGALAHEEREQTLNQLLVELDGFDPQGGVVLMAATNRPEVLDPALLRAGRFDRHILVDRPDMAGRRAILGVHARKVQLADEAALDDIAAMTPGLAGADLANIVNEAALLAARRKADAIEAEDLSEAVERIIAGLEKRNRILSPDEKCRVAHHEVGHALTALSVPGADRVHKISIIPRGIAALGYTLQLPHEDRYLLTRAELEGKIAVLLGGRVAELLVFGDMSTGARDDLRKATDIARSMVVDYGMSPMVGPVSVGRDAPTILGTLAPGGADVSERTARDIDEEIRRIIGEQHDRVTALLKPRRALLERAAAALLDKETLTGEELEQIISASPTPSMVA